MSKRKSESKKRRYKRTAILEKHKEQAKTVIQYFYEQHNLPKGELIIDKENHSPISLYRVIKDGGIKDIFTVINKTNNDKFVCVSTIGNDRSWLEISKFNQIGISTYGKREWDNMVAVYDDPIAFK